MTEWKKGRKESMRAKGMSDVCVGKLEDEDITGEDFG